MTNIPLKFSPFVAGNKANAALVTFNSTRRVPEGDKSTKVKVTSARPWVYWGVNNMMPNEILELTQNTSFVSQIHRKMAAYAVGNGIVLKKRTFVNGKAKLEDYDLPKVSEWLEDSNFLDAAEKFFFDYYHLGVAFPSFALNLEGKVVRIAHNDPTYIRVGTFDAKKGIHTHFYHCPLWSKPTYKVDGDKIEGNVTPIAAFDHTLGAENKPYCMTKIMAYTHNHPYYGLPLWWGSRESMELLQMIPSFHKSGLINGYNIKYHIQIPDTVFSACTSPEEINNLKRELQNSCDEFMAGAENNGKAFTTFAQKLDGAGWAEWKIVELTQNNNDAAYMGVRDMAKEDSIAANAIDPALCGLEATTKMNASGSEKRIAAQIHQRLLTSTRKKVTDLLLWVKALNGWPEDLVFVFEDIDIVTLNENKSGVSAVTATAAIA